MYLGSRSSVGILGVVLDSSNGIIYIPDRGLKKARECIDAIFLKPKRHRRVQVRTSESCRSADFHECCHR